jgi:two-component system sensor histidine kinase RegB
MGRRTKSQQEKAGGLGLGLFIAKTLLERSGATLNFSNLDEPQKGAKVTVTWPRARMEQRFDADSGDNRA